MQAISETSLAEETQRRYLNYALSVITARALPDVRDGLKPVQRRILYAMHNELRLRHDAKYNKCARIVGEVMGKFHPHGDSSIYDALVRLAQSFTMSAPLVDGRGNFGSPDGDSAAAMRYTEARLQALANELLSELGKRVVAFRPNYDGTRFEPAVLPARFPHLLVNGCQGIAVGMATSIPPHNLREVVDATVALIDEPETTLLEITRIIRGPDFPTGGQLVSSKKELEAVYAAGHGSLKLRGEWKYEEPVKRGNAMIILTSTPYAVERRVIVEKIAEVIISRKLPPLLDVRDESTDKIRVVLELRKDADPQLVMAYLFKHTPLATNVQVNMTCLVPTGNNGASVPAPQRLGLLDILRQFLTFRMDVVTKRLQFELDEVLRRIHMLEGFEKIFDALDETIRIIRRSEGKRDAAQKIMKRFGLDEEQVEAILELKLYRLAKLEILLIQKELEEKRGVARKLERLLKSEKLRWKLIRGELLELADTYGQPRRTRVSASVKEPTYQAEDFIVDEDAIVLLTAQGWVKRQRQVHDMSATRVREGDRVIGAVAGSTRSAVAFFSNYGSCYVTRVVDVPATTGYGSPVQTLFKLSDGERIVSAMGFDERVLEVPEPEEEPAPPLVVAVTRKGLSCRFSLRVHREPSTRSGRRFARVAKDDEILSVRLCPEGAHVAAASHRGHALICEAEEITLLAGAGKGVQLMKLAADDYLVGAAVLVRKSDVLEVKNDKGTRYDITMRRYGVVSRGGKGHALFRRGRLSEKVEPEPSVPVLEGEN